MNDIPPVRTEYKGHTFSSKLEARWALFFDLADIPWQYEPNGPNTAPDFWFEDRRYDYLEIKGRMPSQNCYNHMRRIGCQLIAVGGFFKLEIPTLIHVGQKYVYSLSLYDVFDQWTPRTINQALKEASKHRFDLQKG